MGSAFWDTGQFSKLPYLGMKLGKWPKFQKLHMYPLLPQGVEIELIFCSMCSGFRHMGRFSNLPYLGLKLGKGPKIQKLHMYPLSTPGVEIDVIFALRAAVSQICNNFQNCHIWTWNLVSAQSARSCTCTLFLSQGGRSWAYLASTGSGFRDIGQFSK